MILNCFKLPSIDAYSEPFQAPEIELSERAVND